MANYMYAIVIFVGNSQEERQIICVEVPQIKKRQRALNNPV